MNPDLKDYLYELPEDRIAKFPLTDRDQSKLLVYRQGKITHSVFNKLDEFLEPDSYLVFNNTRVIQARLIFHRTTGAKIEIFCIEPLNENDIQSGEAELEGKARWKCMVGNKDKWRNNHEPLVLQKEVNGNVLRLQADLLNDLDQLSLIEFSWNEKIPFFSVLDYFGRTPIPPYLNRQDVPQDKETYQTIYADVKGAVAAPTAGFHFTEKVFEKLGEKGITHDFITLHIGAGTFQPIREPDWTNHPMHEEQIIFSLKNIDQLIQTNRKIISVGTTSLRALESLYWYGVKLLEGTDQFEIEKLLPYQSHGTLPGRQEALYAIKNQMIKSGNEMLVGKTSIFIFPGYRFRMTDGLITNFHLPGSTLLLLIAAFTGEDWKKIYREAFENNYRFLSYGDSSLLLP